MTMQQLAVPEGRTGVVQTSRGTYPIVNGAVEVDALDVLELLRAGFTNPNLPAMTGNDLVAVNLSVQSGIVQYDAQNFPIVDGVAMVPAGAVASLIESTSSDFPPLNDGTQGGPVFFGNFPAGSYSIGGEVGTEPITSEGIYVTAYGTAGGALTITPGVGIVSTSTDENLGRYQATTIDRSITDPLIADGGFVVILTGKIDHANADPLDEEYFNGNLYLQLCNQYAQGTSVLVRRESYDEFGVETQTVVLVQETGALYIVNPVEFGPNGEFTVAARFLTNGDVAASVNGSATVSGTSTTFADDAALFFGMKTEVSSNNNDCSVVITSIEMYALDDPYVAELEGPSSS